MNEFEALISMLDYALDTRSKRHIVGGILMSVSLLFGGLAFTTLTIREVKEDDK